MSNRTIDENGFITIRRNPVSRSGIFQYMGSSIGGDAEPDRIYNVYRPAEEWTADALEGLKHVPWIDDHAMLGGVDSQYMSADQKGIHGITCDEVSFEDGIVYATLKIFSKTMAELIQYGKSQLSLGFRCMWDKVSGVFEGQEYQYIQRNIQPNHLALVDLGRAGSNIAVLDRAVVYDTNDIQVMTSEQGADMADETEETGKSSMTLEECAQHLSEIMPKLAKMNAMLEKGGAGESAAALDGEETEEEKEERLKKEKEAESEKDKDKDKAEDKAAMDAAIETAVSRKVAAIHKDIANKNALYEKVSPMIGAFDHADKSEAELAVYACDKLGISAPKGQEQAYLAGYLTAAAKAPVRSDIAMDSATHVTGSKAVTDYFAKRN